MMYEVAGIIILIVAVSVGIALWMERVSGREEERVQAMPSYIIEPEAGGTWCVKRKYVHRHPSFMGSFVGAHYFHIGSYDTKEQAEADIEHLTQARASV